MDRYFLAKQEETISIVKNDLHLLGLVSIYISSKFEDVIPIFMDNILRDAGHSKFR
jgi:hypothetical protein